MEQSVHERTSGKNAKNIEKKKEKNKTEMK